MPTWQWLPATWTRIVEPFLSTLTPEARDRLERGLERIRQNPQDPTIPSFPWKGNDPSEPVPRTARQALLPIDENTPVQVIYAPYVDFPYIGVVAMLQLDPIPRKAGNGQDS